MTKRVEVEMVVESPEQKDERQSSSIDLNTICRRQNLAWFRYEPDDGEVAFFVHERGEQTGVRFRFKADMAAAVQAFDLNQLTNPESLVTWAGRRGCRLCTSNPKKAEVVRAAKAVLAAAA